MNNQAAFVIAVQVQAILRASGIGVCIEWVIQSIEYLSKKGLLQNDPKVVAGQVYLLFVDSDLHEIASEEGVLPPNTLGIQSGMLSPSSDDLLILQVDEIVNVGSSAAFRSNLTANDEEKELLRGPTAGNTRMLKLYLTDGRQQIIGLELHPMPSLSMEIPPGSKVKLRASCTPMRRGAALLSKDCLVLLEGSVERLCQAGSVTLASTTAIIHNLSQSVLAGEIVLPQRVFGNLQNPGLLSNSHDQQTLAMPPSQLQLHQTREESQHHRIPNNFGPGQSSVTSQDIHNSNNYAKNISRLIVPGKSYRSETLVSPGHLNQCIHQDARNAGDLTYILHQHQPQNHGGKQLSHLTHDVTDQVNYNVLDLCSPPSSPRSLRCMQTSSSSIITSRSTERRDNSPNYNPDLSMLAVSPTSPRSSIVANRSSNSATNISILPRPSPSPPRDDSQTPSPQGTLCFVAMDCISGSESASLSTIEKMRIPHGEFLVSGIAVNIRKFKVTQSEGYVVLLSLEEDEPDFGRDPNRAKVVLPVLVSSNLCAKYLQLPVGEYLSQHENLRKEASKALKIACSLKFRDFRGTFRVKLQPKGPSDPANQLKISSTNTGTSTGPPSQSADATSLLLLDFHEAQG